MFDPAKWGERRVDVIGVGATGSKVALSLAKLGVQNLHVWDGDVVESHNLANQVYGPTHLGMNKAAAFATAMLFYVEREPTVHGAWQPGEPLGEVVFSMSDSMTVRRQVYEAVRFSAATSLLIDSRMGARHGQLLGFEVGDPGNMEHYESTLFGDDDGQVEASACGTAITVGPTGDIIAGFAVWQFIQHARGLKPVWNFAVQGDDPSIHVIARSK